MDESWHEVLRLIAGMIEARFVGEIIEFLMDIDGEEEEFNNLFLAAECLGEVRNRKVIEEIDTRLYRRIIILIHYNDYYLIHGKNKRDTIFEINKKGVERIGTVWDRHPRTLTMLKELAIKGHNDVVQYHAVITIANSLKNDSKTLSWLKNIPIENGDDVSTIAALEGVARYFQEDLTILPWLKNIASNNGSDFIRYHAIQALVRNFKTDSDTLDFLKQCIQLGECWNVRCKALEELANNCKDEPSIFEFFYGFALNDPFKPIVCEDELVEVEYLETNPRQTALEIILKNYPNHPKTLPLLRDRAKNDPDEQLREFAQKKLQKWNKK